MTNSSFEIPKDHEKNLARWKPEPSWYAPLVCGVVEGLSAAVMRLMNNLHFHDRHFWDEAFASTEKGVLSFSNHVSLFDDPLLIANLGRTAYPELRWIGADDKNFFGNSLKGWVYSAGKVVPLVRGGGLEQPGFDHLMERLKQGDWVHIFPEGGRTRDPEARLKTPFKRGIGKLVEGALPIALPFYHYGMHQLLPIGSKFPKVGKEVHVYFDAPTVISEKWLTQFPAEATVDRWDQIAQWSYQALRKLEEKVHPNP